MAVPTEVIYSLAMKTALSNEFLAFFFPYPAYIQIRDADDLLLAEIATNDPPGTVQADGSIAITTIFPDYEASASGIAAYMELWTDDGTPPDSLALSMPIVEGVASQRGYLVMTSTTIIAGQPVGITGFTIG